MALSAGPRGCRRLITRPALPGGRNTIEIQVRRALSVADTEAAAAWPAGPLVADDLTPKAAGAQSGKGTVASYAPSIPPIAADFCGLFVKSYKFICAMSNTATKIAKVIFGNTACLVARREWVELVSSYMPWMFTVDAQTGTRGPWVETTGVIRQRSTRKYISRRKNEG
jgi:hypothetical protein